MGVVVMVGGSGRRRSRSPARIHLKNRWSNVSSHSVDQNIIVILDILMFSGDKKE